MKTKFEEQIEGFNKFYGLPSEEHAQMPDLVRLEIFGRMLLAELHEGEDVGHALIHGSDGAEHPIVKMADWLGDIIVYCASEMRRHGIPIQATLDIIMASNMTKAGADGKPIVINGKVVKGPDFVPPEPELAKLLLNE